MNEIEKLKQENKKMQEKVDKLEAELSIKNEALRKIYNHSKEIKGMEQFTLLLLMMLMY